MSKTDMKIFGEVVRDRIFFAADTADNMFTTFEC